MLLSTWITYDTPKIRIEHWALSEQKCPLNWPVDVVGRNCVPMLKFETGVNRCATLEWAVDSHVCNCHLAIQLRVIKHMETTILTGDPPYCTLKKASAAKLHLRHECPPRERACNLGSVVTKGNALACAFNMQPLHASCANIMQSGNSTFVLMSVNPGLDVNLPSKCAP